MQFVTCRIGEQLFGVDITLVREINNVLEITRIPRERDYIRGLINLRGQIVTILDMRVRLGMSPIEHTVDTHNIIIKGRGELNAVCTEALRASMKDIADPAGLLVDGIGDVVDAADHELEPPPANIESHHAGLLMGMVKKEDALIAILDIGKVLSLN
jgi:purine-binding chemotaxis protein CheW